MCEICFPDYNHSTLDISSTLLHYYGAPSPHADLPILNKALQEHLRNIILMIFDRMGSDILKKIALFIFFKTAYCWWSYLCFFTYKDELLFCYLIISKSYKSLKQKSYFDVCLKLAHAGILKEEMMVPLFLIKCLKKDWRFLFSYVKYVKT